MMGNTQKKIGIGLAAAAVLGVGWALFRPELLFVNQVVNETFPVARAEAAQARELAAGAFRSDAHETRGKATIYEVGGRRVLRLTGFHTSNGPDVRVLLVAAPDVKNSGTVKKAGFLDLGALKGNQGDQNYDLPAAANLDKHRSVSIWCRRFSVNFGAAPLARVQGT
jgi:hypothetical protein